MRQVLYNMLHVLDTGHAYGTINEIMEVVKIQEKGKHLKTLEKYHIYLYINKESNLIITAQTPTTQFLRKYTTFSDTCYNAVPDYTRYLFRCRYPC
jgi:hypothetical protein